MRDRSGASPTKHSPAAARAAQAAQITGFRIMRQFEIAPGWWGQPTEVGDTPSATVADSFCREQNAVTMNANRTKRIEYYAEPIAPGAATPAETASRYRQAAAHLRDLSIHGDYDACADTQDEMAMCRCQLAAAGRLDLIGANA